MLELLLPNLPTIVIGIAVALGGLWVFRRSYARDLSGLQERVISAYKTQVEVLETELRFLRREVTAMRLGFRHLGVAIEIIGDEIILTIEGDKPKQTRIMAIKIDEEEEKSKNGTIP